MAIKSISEDDVDIIASCINDSITDVLAEKYKFLEYIAMYNDLRNPVVAAFSQVADAFIAVSESIQSTDTLVQQIKDARDEQNEGSKQITQALHFMNDSTIEVRSASEEMTEGNKHILEEITALQQITTKIKDSIEEMTNGAQLINDTGVALNEISNQVTESIDAINGQIDLFKV